MLPILGKNRLFKSEAHNLNEQRCKIRARHKGHQDINAYKL